MNRTSPQHPRQIAKYLPYAVVAVLAYSPLAHGSGFSNTAPQSASTAPEPATQPDAAAIDAAAQREAERQADAALSDQGNDNVASASPAASDPVALPDPATATAATAVPATDSATAPANNPWILRILCLLLAVTVLAAIAYIRALINAEARERSAQPSRPQPSSPTQRRDALVPPPITAAVAAPANMAQAIVPATTSTAPQPAIPETPPAPAEALTPAAPVISESVINLPSAAPTEPTTPAAADNSTPDQSSLPAEKAIEFIRPVMTAVQGNTGSGLRPNSRHNLGQALSMTPGKVRLYVEQHLDAFAKDLLLEPMAYRAELRKAELDYSAASLARVDQFLIQLRLHSDPDITDYTNRDDHRTLLVFLGFYVATTIARITSQTISWYDYASLRIRMQNPTLLASLHNCYSCVLGRNNHFMPIELITSILFEANTTRSCTAQLIHAQQHAQPFTPIPRSSQHSTVSADTDQERAWVDAVRLAGHLAAKSVYQLQHGALIPMLMYPKNRVQLVSESLIGDDPAEFLERMKLNPEQLAYQAVAYDSSANLPTGTCPALTITARCYGDYPAEWTVMLPYRPASDPAGFAIFTPLLAPSDTPAYYNPLLMHAFYNGVVMISLPGNPWQSHLQEA